MSPAVSSLLHTPAPDFHLLDTRGRTRSLADLMGPGGLVLVFFVSGWWPGDRALLQSYMRAYPELQAQGIAVAALSGVNWETAFELDRALQPSFPLLFDPCCRVAKRYGVMWIPKFVNAQAVVALDAQGAIRLAGKGRILPRRVLDALQNRA